MKDELELFVSWMLDEKNKRFVKNGSSRKIAEQFNNETNSNISHIYVNNHRFRWIRIDGALYDVTKLPPFILYDESFKKYAKDNNMTIETLDWSINVKSPISRNDIEEQKEIIVEKI